MTTLFDTAFTRLLGNEGGYTPGVGDRGGETNWGISKASYPDVDIKNLTRDGAKAIYLRDFWNRIHADELAPAMSFQVFDTAVNSGVEQAVRLLQRALSVPDDGQWGPVTLAAANAVADGVLVLRYIAERLDFYRGLSTWYTFGRGWAGRAATNLRYAAEDV